MIEITGGDYRVRYDPSTAIVTFTGVLRLYGTNGYVSIRENRKNRKPSPHHPKRDTSGGYTSIMKLLTDIVDQSPKRITIDLRELQFLNSSGINVLSKFTIMLHKQHASQLVILGNPKRSWQHTVFNNLKRLMPDLTLTFEEGEKKYDGTRPTDAV